MAGLPSRLRLGVAAGVAATLLGAALLVAAFLWPSGPVAPAAAGEPPASSAAGTAAARDGIAAGAGAGSVAPTSAGPSASATPGRGTPATSGSPAPRTTAAAVPLTARFAKHSDGLAGYAATITVTNPGGGPASGWTVQLTLPRSTLSVTDVSGATATQNGAVWTFVPNADTAQVGAGRSVAVGFRVSGAALLDGSPTACTIDGRGCQGL
jgi:hypothetical protein